MDNDAAADRDRVNILLVDDRRENLLALSAILTDPDYRIVTAGSGPQALSALLRDEFALVILDVMMPEMDGYQVATLMKERGRTQHIPIIFLTAIANEVSHIYKGYSAGAVDYLMKPLEPEIVKAKVAVFIDLFRSKQQIRRQEERFRLIERQENEAWFSTTLKSIGDAVIATDTQGRIRFINPIGESLTGWTLGEAHGKPVEEVFRIINEQTRCAIESPVAKILREGVVVGLADHTVLNSKDGREYHLQDSGAPILGQSGVILGAVIVFRDATESRREAQRRALMSRVNSILLSSLDYSVTLETVARLLIPFYADCCCVELVSDHGTIERMVVAHVDTEKEREIRGGGPVSHRVIRTGKMEVVPDLGDSPLSALGFRSCVSLPLSQRGGSLGALTLFSGPDGHRNSAQDIAMLEELATRVSTAIENSRLYDGAQRAIRLRDEFLSIASHELRTPITPLKLQLQTLHGLVSRKMIDTYPREKIDLMFSIADRQMERFQKLIEELLDVSRIRVGRLELEREGVDLAEVIREIVSQFADELRSADCRVDVKAEPALGNWDKLRIEQVLINLLGNAMKYGAGKPIHISLENENGTARLKVQDHGPGMAKDDQLRIFDRFERVASPRHFPGLGLGLYITRQILEAHSGKIWVESELGRGATFFVELPLRTTEVKTNAA